MNYPPYSSNPNDPNDPHSQPTTAGQYPQWGQQPPQFPQQPGQPSSPQWGQQAPPPPPQFPQQPGQYSQSGQNFPPYPGQYPQNGQFGPPPNPQQLTAKPTFKQRFRAMSPWKRFGTIGCSTIIATIMVCSLCAIVGNALPAAPKQSSTADIGQASPTEHQVVHNEKPKPTPSPIATPTPSPTPTPTPTPTPEPTQVPMQQQPVQQPPVQQPVQQPPAPAPAPSGVNGNPWGYNFDSTGGSLIYSPASNFCTAGYFSCINNFWNGNGYVEECQDGMYGKSGGISGSCSHHGGNQQPLYSH